jgi:hypothetical protein
MHVTGLRCGAKRAKVFWFFFSKKNILPFYKKSQGHALAFVVQCNGVYGFSFQSLMLPMSAVVSTTPSAPISG